MSEFILIFIAIIVLFSFFRRYIFFFIMRAVSKRMFDHVQKQYKNQTGASRPEGSVTIDTSKDARGKKRNDEGEYVNYEEVE